MATKIVTKNSSTASAVPTASDLVQGELAVNVADKRLFTEDNAGAIVELGTNPSALTVAGEITANGGIALGDNDKATFGAGDDLQIYHTGSYSAITDVGTGAFYIGGADFVDIGNSTLSETSARFHVNDRVDLYHNNAIKLTTTATGIDVTGRAVVGSGSFDGGGVIHNYGSDGNSRSWWAKTDTHGYGDFAIRQSTTQTGSTYQTRLLIDSSGNVGIGTSSPSSELHISSDAPIITATATNNNSGLRLNVVGGGIELLRLQDNGTERLRVDASGNVGIGTSSPTRRLHVYGASGAVARITGPNAYNAESGLEFSVGRAKISGVLNGSGGTPGAALRFYTMPNSGSVTERMRIDSTGNLLVGKTYTATGNAGQEFRAGGYTAFTRSGGNPLELNRLTNDGTIANFSKDGTTVGSISSVGGADIKVVLSSDGDQYITGNSAANYMSFSAANQERARIDSSGNLLVGATGTSFSERFKVVSSGQVYAGIFHATASANAPLICRNENGVSGSRSQVLFLYDSSTVGSISSSPSATGYNTSSDYRLKENIADADDAGSKVDSIQVRKFDWKVDGSHQDYGMIAQELLEVAPEAVSVPEDSEEMMGVDYSKLVPMLIKEIQSLRNRVAQLEE